uniref:Uncharacterized protein n=1 Tax=Anguilla anguilla TaxID=7936 RepID=A0A0E9XKC2_ANGAN
MKDLQSQRIHFSAVTHTKFSLPSTFPANSCWSSVHLTTSFPLFSSTTTSLLKPPPCETRHLSPRCSCSWRKKSTSDSNSRRQYLRRSWVARGCSLLPVGFLAPQAKPCSSKEWREKIGDWRGSKCDKATQKREYETCGEDDGLSPKSTENYLRNPQKETYLKPHHQPQQDS